MALTPKNWKSFQHYNQRRPPWIKLHRSLLDDLDFDDLPLASQVLAPKLWLLASEYEGGAIAMPASKIARRLRIAEADYVERLQPLLDAGYFVIGDVAPVDSEPLADRKHDATLRREEKSRGETEGGGVERAHTPAKQIDLEDAIAAAAPKPAGKSLIGEDAFALATELLAIMGKDPFDPLSVGAPLTVQSWLNGGWHRDCIITGVKAGMQSRNGEAPSTLKYFEKAIARSHAQLNAPVPTAAAPPARAGRPLTEFQRSRNETRDILNDLEHFAAGGGIGSQAHSRLLSGDPGQRSAELCGGLGGDVVDIPAIGHRAGN